VHFAFILLVSFVCDGGQNGETLLIWASRNGHLEIMKILLDRGAEIGKGNQVNSNCS
jgi:ankyrin repeat protein